VVQLNWQQVDCTERRFQFLSLKTDFIFSHSINIFSFSKFMKNGKNEKNRNNFFSNLCLIFCTGSLNEKKILPSHGTALQINVFFSFKLLPGQLCQMHIVAFV